MLAVDWYTADWNRRPPAMPWDDWVVWSEWLRTHAAKHYHYAYDVELYTQELPEQIRDQAMLRMWARNTARRIDVVAWDGHAHILIETRRRAGWSAVAQIIGYRELWQLQLPAEPISGIWLLAETIADDIRALARRQGVKTWTPGELEPT